MVSPMKSSRNAREHSLLATLTLAGAALAGNAGIRAGGFLGRIAAIPLTAAAAGYGAGGWVSAVAGLVMGTAANFWPLARKAADALPAEADSPPSEKYETVRLSDYAAKIGGISGGLAGAFTGAAVGAGLAGIITLSETRQAMLNGDLPGDRPRDRPGRRKDRDNGPFIH